MYVHSKNNKYYQVEEKISEIASLSTKLESSESQLESIMTEYNQTKSKLAGNLQVFYNISK